MKSENKKKNIKDAINLFHSKLYDESLIAFNQYLQENPDASIAYYYLGRIHFIKKNYSIAHNFFTIAHTNLTDHELTSYYYGRTLLFTKRYSESIQILERITHSMPSAHMFIALSYFHLGHYKKANQHLDQTPGDLRNKKQFINLFSAVLYNIGINLFSNGQHEESIELFEKSLKVNPAMYQSLFQIGSIYIELKKYYSAIDIFEKLKNYYKTEVIELSLSYLYNKTDQTEKLEKLLSSNTITTSHSNEQFSNIFAYALIRNKKYKEAIPILLQLYKKNYYDEMLLYLVAIARNSIGEPEKALKAFQLIYRITDKNILINNSYLLLLIESNTISEAYARSEKFIEYGIFDNKTLLLHYYAAIFSNKIKNFEAQFTHLSKIFGENTLFLEATGRYYKDIQPDIDLATHYYYTLYNKISDDPHTINSLVDLFIQKEMKNQAVYYLSKIYEKQPHNSTIVYYYGYFLIRTGNFNKAIAILTKSEKNHTTSFLLSQAHLLLGHQKESIFHLTQSLSLNPLYLPALYKLLIVFYKRKKIHKALKICGLIEKSNPDFHRVELYKAVIYVNLSRYELSLESIKKYAVKSEKRTQLHPYLRMMSYTLLYYDGKTEKTIEFVSNKIRKNGKNAPLLTLLALCLKRKFAINELKKTEKHLINGFPDSPSTKQYCKRHIDLDTTHLKRVDLGIRIF